MAVATCRSKKLNNNKNKQTNKRHGPWVKLITASSAQQKTDGGDLRGDELCRLLFRSFARSCSHFNNRQASPEQIHSPSFLERVKSPLDRQRISMFFPGGSVILPVIWACWGALAHSSLQAGQTSRVNRHANIKHFHQLATFPFSRQS